MNNNVLQPPKIKPSDTRLNWGNLHGSALSLAIANHAMGTKAPILVVTKDLHSAHDLKRELNFYANNGIAILDFPDNETLAYDSFSPHDDLVSERLKALYQIPSLASGIIIAALPSLMQRLAPKDYIQTHSFIIETGHRFNLTNLAKQLSTNGYHSVDQVLQHGEFAIRGSIIDLFPMGSNLPYRIELLDDEVETIRSFDPDSQRSHEKTNEIRLLPAHEYPLTDQSITLFRQQWREKFDVNPNNCPLYNSISAGEHAAGIEYYLPLFFEETMHFFDYLPNNAQIIFTTELKTTLQQFNEAINERYEQMRHDITRPICKPNELYISEQDFFNVIKPFLQVHTQSMHLIEKQGNINFNSSAIIDFEINSKLKHPFAKIKEFIETYDGKLLFTAESLGRQETLLDALKQNDIKITLKTSWDDFLTAGDSINLCVAPIDNGLNINNPNIMLITEAQLYGQHVMQRRLRKQSSQDPNTIIRNLIELKPGAAVVHIEYGIGRYKGLDIIKTAGIEAEYLTIEYAAGDKIYVPITNLNLISRYTGRDSDHAPLQRLGNSQWEKNKRKTLEKIRDVAAELLDVYSKRKATPGHAFPPPDENVQKFRHDFTFEETPDQTQAINAVIRDMTSEHSMDRLVCGDVGFGKTEVAMQAAFLAAYNGKQAAILVPTTLLANQHTENFKDRFANWPIKIAELTRMQSKKQQDETIAALKKGSIDIVIGTHKLLNTNIEYKDLGLLVIDEEQRFGVKQKEKVMAMRSHIDILTLTATPIPRTLNMALSGTRDISIIATPPAKRLAIKTFVNETNKQVMREAIYREILRGGQIYFIHNDIASQEATKQKILEIAPQAKIAIAHGQMRERQLEQVMSDFYHQKFNILLCTTIIESGIDVPSANTIIINKADHFGLSQLHQLRGRVGRSHRQAYAYLLVQDKKAITKDAAKRLDAISELEDLGAGFMLANHDLEIRGAGNILGEEQSGNIEAMGFSLYMELLEEAVNAIKSGKKPSFDLHTQQGPEIDLHISTLIPESLIHDIGTRLTLYKRLSSCKTNKEIAELKEEMIDRFGLLPEPMQNLLEIASLKLVAGKIGIKKIDVGNEYGYIDFIDKPNIDPLKIIDLVQKFSRQYQLQGSTRLRFTRDTKVSKIEATKKLLSKLQK